MRGLTITSNTLLKPALGLLALVGLISCGPSQYTMNDSIYGGRSTVYEEPTQEVASTTANGGVYANYFNQGAADLDAAQQSGDIFTDIDSYSSNSEYTTEEAILDEGLAYQAQPGWGDVVDDITINIYPNFYNRIGFGGFYRPFWNTGWGWGGWSYPNSGFGWGGWWNPYNGYGWGGWGNPYFGYAYNGWGFGGWGYPYGGWGFGWNAPFYGYYGYNIYFGAPFIRNRYYARYNTGRVAYSNSRRANSLYSSRSNARSSATRSSRRSNVNYARTSRTYSRNNVGVNTNRLSRNSNNSSRATNATRSSSNSSIYRSNARRTSSNTITRSSSRSSTPVRATRSSTYSRNSVSTPTRSTSR